MPATLWSCTKAVSCSIYGAVLYEFELSERPLSDEEQETFDHFLKEQGLDSRIWPVFDLLFDSCTPNTKPMVLRAHKNSELVGAAIIIQCKKYGRALFDNTFLSGTIDLLRIPVHLWIKFGCCMDMMSNPGFSKNPPQQEELNRLMAAFMREKYTVTIVNDFSTNSTSYPFAAELPALPHALVNTEGMSEISDYTKTFKNIRKKQKKFRNRGGEIDIVKGRLGEGELAAARECFLSTASKSVFYLPYQDLYLASALRTSSALLEDVYYFLAKLDGEIVGYQAAIKTGKNLNALHGAFNRNRGSNFHAYDLLFVEMVDFAITNSLELIDFGAVLNITKQKMVNKKNEMSYFLFSRYGVVQWFFNGLLKVTKIQSDLQLQFRE